MIKECAVCHCQRSGFAGEMVAATVTDGRQWKQVEVWVCSTCHQTLGRMTAEWRK